MKIKISERLIASLLSRKIKAGKKLRSSPLRY